MIIFLFKATPLPCISYVPGLTIIVSPDEAFSTALAIEPKEFDSLPSLLSFPLSATHHIGPEKAGVKFMVLDAVPSKLLVFTAATLK